MNLIDPSLDPFPEMSGVSTHPLADRESLVNLEQFCSVPEPPADFGAFLDAMPDIYAGTELKTLVERIGKMDPFIPYAGLVNPRSREMRDKFAKAVESNGHKYDTSFVVVHFGNEVRDGPRPMP